MSVGALLQTILDREAFSAFRQTLLDRVPDVASPHIDRSRALRDSEFARFRDTAPCETYADAVNIEAYYERLAAVFRDRENRMGKMCTTARCAIVGATCHANDTESIGLVAEMVLAGLDAQLATVSGLSYAQLNL